MLPFRGLAHVGYLPGKRIHVLSKLARVVELFARRPQVQERLTKQMPTGCTPTSTLLGTLRDTLREDARSRAEFLALTARTTGGGLSEGLR